MLAAAVGGKVGVTFGLSEMKIEFVKFFLSSFVVVFDLPISVVVLVVVVLLLLLLLC